MEWISINERLPDGECLAICMVKGHGYKEMLIGYIGEDEYSPNGYSCETDGIFLYNVTHWMPLPEPPKN